MYKSIFVPLVSVHRWQASGALGLPTGLLLLLGLLLPGVAPAQVGTLPPRCLAPAGAGQPAPPQAGVDVTYPAAAGNPIAVGAGGNLQAALDAAQPGDEIVLSAGAVFTGSFTLPAKAGAGWIVVRSSALAVLPKPGQRVGPAHAGAMPKILSAGGVPALRAAPGAGYWRLVGLEVAPAPGTYTTNLIELSGDATTDAELPHHITIDRCYLHGDPAQGGRRGVALNSKSTAVIDSYLAEFKEVGADSQAICGWGGPGPFLIRNNYLAGAGENVMFGGGDPAILNLVPSDITIVGNHFHKPLGWQIGHPSYQGTPWSVKNLFELKNARRVLVAGNVFENNWPHAQSGFAILFTVRNQDGSAPWSAVEDVNFACNHVDASTSSLNLHPIDNNFPSQTSRRLRVAHNLFTGEERGFQALVSSAAASQNLAFEHNTMFGAINCLFLGDQGLPHAAFVFRDNLCGASTYGVFGNNVGSGTVALNTYLAPGYVFARNAVVGASAPAYPANNFYPADDAAVGFVDPAAGDFRLRADSPLAGQASDGTDVGASFTALWGALRQTLFADDFETGGLAAWS